MKAWGNRTVPTGPIWDAAVLEKNWLIYKLIPRSEGGKPIKRPSTATGQAPIATASAACLTYAEATEALASLLGDYGLGYLPRVGSAIVCVDLDKVLGPDGQIVEEHEALVDEMLTGETYAEFSPSGLGLHILVARGDWGLIKRDRSSEGLGLLANETLFFTVSLRQLAGTPRAITDAPRLRARMQPHIERWAADERSATMDEPAAAPSGAAWRWFDDLSTDEQAACAAEMLATLPQEMCDERDYWRDATFALRQRHHLHTAWDAWSRRSTNYNGAENLALWNERERGQKRITMGSLIHWAEAAGWDAGPWKRRAKDGRMRRVIQKQKAMAASEREVLEAKMRLALRGVSL